MAFVLLNGIIYFVSGAFKKNLYAVVFATSVAIFIQVYWLICVATIESVGSVALDSLSP